MLQQQQITPVGTAQRSYHQLFAMVRAQGDLLALRELIALLAKKEQKLRGLSITTQQRLAREKLRGDDAHAARYRHLVSMYTHLGDTLRRIEMHLAKAQRLGIDSRDALTKIKPEVWDTIQPHQVLREPHFGLFSFYDLTQLLDGSSWQDAGMAQLTLDDYGLVVPEPQGWHIRTNGYSIQVNGAVLFPLLKGATAFQYVPFSKNGVLPTTLAKGTYDGVSLVIEHTSVRDTTGEEWTIEEPIRLSLKRYHYTALVESQDKEKQTTIQLFGSLHVPNNLYEVEWWHTNTWLARKPEQEQERFFYPGMSLAAYSRRSLADLALFTEIYKAEEIRKAQLYGKTSSGKPGEQLNSKEEEEGPQPPAPGTPLDQLAELVDSPF